MSQQVQWISPTGTTLTFSTAEGSALRFTRKYDGFGKINTDHQTFQSPLQDGITPVHTRIPERHISFEIKITAADLPSLEALELSLIQALNPMNGTGTLVYTQEGGSVYAIPCRGYNTPTFSTTERGPTWQQATLEFIAFYPFWISTTPITVPLAAFTGGFAEPLTSPFNFGLATNAATVTNIGDVACPAVIIFNGAITNPRLDNLSTGEYIAAIMDLLSGEQIIITTGPGAPSVRYLHGTSNDNGFQYLSDDSIMFWLQPGDNDLDFSASSSVGSDASMSLTFYPQFSGV